MVATRVLLAFQSPELRRHLRLMIDESEDVEVIGEAGDALEIVEQVTALRPDVVLMEAEMPQVTGIETTRVLQSQGYSGAIIVVSNDVSQLEDALRSGAAGYLIKNCPADEVLGAIRQAPEGGFVFGGSVMKTSEGMEVAVRYMTDRKIPDGATAAAEEAEMVEEAPEDPAGGVADQTESATPRPASGPDALLGDVELVVSPPVDTTFVLRLYQWLLGEAFADVNEVAGSWTGDTVVKVTFRARVTLSKMFDELPDIGELNEEPYAEDSGTESRSLRPLWSGIRRTLPRRFRIVLKRG